MCYVIPWDWNSWANMKSEMYTQMPKWNTQLQFFIMLYGPVFLYPSRTIKKEPSIVRIDGIIGNLLLASRIRVAQSCLSIYARQPSYCVFKVQNHIWSMVKSWKFYNTNSVNQIGSFKFCSIFSIDFICTEWWHYVCCLLGFSLETMYVVLTL